MPSSFNMAILVGEYNGSEPSNSGRRIIVKHMPDVALCIEGKAWERVERSYGAILQARDADVARKPRVMMAALIYAKRAHVESCVRLHQALMPRGENLTARRVDTPTKCSTMVPDDTRQGPAVIRPLDWGSRTRPWSPGLPRGLRNSSGRQDPLHTQPPTRSGGQSHHQHGRQARVDEQPEGGQGQSEVRAGVDRARPHRVVQGRRQHAHHRGVDAAHRALHAVALPHRFPEKFVTATERQRMKPRKHEGPTTIT